MDNYLDVTADVYKQAAITPDVGLCCTTTPVWAFPGLNIPGKMQEMNYGCGSTVHPRDLINQPRVLYVGIGGGMELLQFAYFSRSKGSIIGVDNVTEMITACDENLETAAAENNWFEKDFISLKQGTALDLPVESNTIDVAAQNCLFNIFKLQDLKTALAEMYRVLKPNGRLVLSDPISNQALPQHLIENPKLRALCLSGALPLKSYIDIITETGFGTVEIRARRPYRILEKDSYKLDEHIFLESVEVCAIKDPMPKDGPCVFTGKTAIYFGGQDYFDDHSGHVLMKNQPLSVCDKTANNLLNLDKNDIFISGSTYFYDGGGCC